MAEAITTLEKDPALEALSGKSSTSTAEDSGAVETTTNDKPAIEQAPTKQFDDGKDLHALTGKEPSAGLDAFAKELGGELPGLSTELEEKARKTNEEKSSGAKKGEEARVDSKVSTEVDTKDGKDETKESKGGVSTDDTTKQAIAKLDKAPTEEELKGRDFTGLEENEVPLLQRMSNSAFNYVKPALIELKAKRIEAKRLLDENAQLRVGKVTLPENYNEHPSAYVLTPEFGEISGRIQQATAFKNHWTQQAINIENGKDWQPIVSDGKGGYVAGAAQPASVEAKYQVLQNLQHVTAQEGREQGKLEALQTNHTTKYKEAIGGLVAKEKELFGYMDDEKNPSNKTFKEIKGMFHQSFQQNPVTNLAAKALTGLLQYKAAYEQLAAKQTTTAKVAETIADDTRRAGPTNKTIDSGGTKKVTAKVSMADFKSAMED